MAPFALIMNKNTKRSDRPWIMEQNVTERIRQAVDNGTERY